MWSVTAFMCLHFPFCVFILQHSTLRRTTAHHSIQVWSGMCLHVCLSCITAHCDALQRTTPFRCGGYPLQHRILQRSTLHCTATPCNAPRCHALQHSTLQRTAAHSTPVCSNNPTTQHNATYYHAPRCNTPSCNALQHTPFIHGVPLYECNISTFLGETGICVFTYLRDV